MFVFDYHHHQIDVSAVFHFLPHKQMDRELVRAGGYLHDVSKAASIVAREMEKEGHVVERVPHDILGGRVLRARGLPEALAHVVESHGQVNVNEFDPNGPLTEAELVCYADKRVTGTSVVSLADRHDGLFLSFKSHSLFFFLNVVHCACVCD